MIELNVSRGLQQATCLLFGHTYDEDEGRYIGHDVCARCGYEPDAYEVIKISGLLNPCWWLFHRNHEQMRRFKEWWRCSECGRHCGRHDKNFDHIPF